MTLNNVGASSQNWVRRQQMKENEKKALTTAAIAAGYIAWFMGKAMTSGIRTRKGTGRKS